MHLENRSYLEFVVKRGIINHNAVIKKPTFQGKTTMYIGSNTVRVKNTLSKYNVEPIKIVAKVKPKVEKPNAGSATAREEGGKKFDMSKVIQHEEEPEGFDGNEGKADKGFLAKLLDNLPEADKAKVEAVVAQDYEELKAADLPQVVKDAVAKTYEGTVIAKAFGNEKGEYKLVLTSAEAASKGKAGKTVYVNGKGEFIEK